MFWVMHIYLVKIWWLIKIVVIILVNFTFSTMQSIPKVQTTFLAGEWVLEKKWKKNPFVTEYHFFPGHVSKAMPWVCVPSGLIYIGSAQNNVTVQCSCRCLALFCNQKPYIFIYIFWNFVEIFRTLQKYNYSWLFISWWRSYIFSLFRGFLKSDKALGQANIKFEHFNNRCEIHECVDVSILYEA